MSEVPQITFERRLNGIFWAFVVVFAVLILRLGYLQIVQGANFKDAIHRSRLVRDPLLAPRGDILDRQGRPLAWTTSNYALFLYPSKFRESNRVHALVDLTAAWLPDLLPRVEMERPGLMFKVRRELNLWRGVHRNRERIVSRLLSLPIDSLVWDREVLDDRMTVLTHEKGSLLLPPSRLPQRLRQALFLIGDREALVRVGTVAERLNRSTTLAEALNTTVRKCVGEMDGEYAQIEWLAAGTGMESADEFIGKIFTTLIREIRRIERKLEEIVDDQIVVEELGTCELEKLDEETRAELVAELQVTVADPQLVAASLSALRRRVDQDDVDEQEIQSLEAVGDILRGRSPSRLQDYELRAMSRLLGLWDSEPRALKSSLARSIRNRADFSLDQYVTEHKDWERRLRFKRWFSYELARDCDFELATRVWETFGLRRLGFDVVTGWGREYWEDDLGVASFLVGRVNKSGKGIAGLEMSLDDPRHDASIGGVDGVSLKIREPDGTLRKFGVEQEPRAGASVRLTIDRDLQLQVENVLGHLVAEHGNSANPATGAGACVIDIATGDVLALASFPRLPGHEFSSAWRSLEQSRNELHAATLSHNRGAISQEALSASRTRWRHERRTSGYRDRANAAAGQGYSPPGSVMKVFAALASLQDGVITPDDVVSCGSPKWHNEVAMRDAIVVSCNRYFWDLAGKLRRDWLLGWYQRFGMFEDIPHLSIPGSGAQRRRNVEEDSVKNLIIGQGSLSSAPLELATMWANLGRYGRVVTPKIVLKVGDRDMPTMVRGEIPLKKAQVDLVLDAARGVVEKIGRKNALMQQFDHLEIAGKTGTAEGYAGEDADENIAWFAGLAPYRTPRLAFAVFCEHTYAQGRHVAPFVAEIVKLASESRIR